MPYDNDLLRHGARHTKRVESRFHWNGSATSMRFIQGLSDETTHLLQRIYQNSTHHRVRQRAHCVLLSFQGYTPKELAHIFHVDRITIYNWFDAWDRRRFCGL